MNRACLLLSVALILSALPTMGQTNSVQSDKEDNIRHLLTVMGTEKLQQNLIDQMLGALKPMMARASNGDPEADKIINRMSELMIEEYKKADFLSLNIDLYDKYFTNEEIKGLIQFYESPVGQKTIQAMPALTQESMTRGMAIGQAIVPKVMIRLIAEFPELKSMLKPPVPPAKP